MTENIPPLIGEKKPGNSAGLAGFIIALLSPMGCGILSVLGVIVSLIGMTRKPRGLAATGLVLSLITGAAWVVGFWIGVDAALSTFRNYGETPASIQVWRETASSARRLAKTRPSEDSGTLSGLSVYQNIDERIPLDASWVRSGEEYVVTAKLAGPLPEGVKETTARLHGLPGGKIAADFSDLHKWANDNRGIIQNLIRPLVISLLNTLEPEVEDVVQWVESHDGKLPGDEVGNGLFAKVPRNVTQPDGRSRVKIISLTYTRMPEGHFELVMDYESQINNTNTRTSITAVFTPDGRMVDPFETFEGMGFDFDDYTGAGP